MLPFFAIALCTLAETAILAYSHVVNHAVAVSVEKAVSVERRISIQDRRIQTRVESLERRDIV